MNIYLEKIRDIASEYSSKKVTIMEVCGGHTNTIMQYGIRDVLPKNVRLVSGPGCPVCVTDQRDIDHMVALARAGIPVATYGDMMHVPGTKGSLEKAKEEGKDVKMVMTAMEMLEPENRDRVFFGIGFETTTPMTAYLLHHGITVYSAHKVMPPPMKILVKKTDIDGFLDPGHVSCITGAKIWEDLTVPQVIAGFKKDQIIRAIYKLLQLIFEKKNLVINDYPEVVSYEGNQKAQELIEQTMKPYNARWRGMGPILESGLEPRDDNCNARKKYADILLDVKKAPKTACRCGEILQGKCEPTDCPLFGSICTPRNPIGACMVSETEGACGIAYKCMES